MVKELLRVSYLTSCGTTWDFNRQKQKSQFSGFAQFCFISLLYFKYFAQDYRDTFEKEKIWAIHFASVLPFLV